ncbi:hypothetical protein TSUD_276390 [Trifolium subterraneum]|uniref:RNA-directed DNA polymerase n=1 Tax=Trifolium subterraneum TaxID=3900 RepID=A0A2Z6N276_TRISU|nr:hypothetical protein TSUD_276390 [Trifolium subterraneum]
MRRHVPAVNLLFDPEIERMARRNNSRTRKKKQLAKQKEQQEGSSVSISSTSPIAEEIMADIPQAQPEGNGGGPMSCHNSPRRLAHLARPQRGARQTEMKTGFPQLLYANPFASLPHEDPYNHLVKFYEIAGSLGATEAEEESVFQRRFPHSLIEKAKDWYLDKPPARYKSMLWKCPNHGFDDLTQIHIFRNGLQQQSNLLLDATAGGSLLSLSVADATTIIEKMALSDRQGEYNRNPSQRKPGILELDTSYAVLAQNKLLTNTVEELSKQMSKLISIQEGQSKAKQVAYCQLCTGDHPTGHCSPNDEEGWKQDVGSSNRQRQYESFNQPPPQQSQNSDLEATLHKFMEMQMKQNQETQEIGKGIGDNLQTEEEVVGEKEKHDEEKEEEAGEKNKEGVLVEKKKIIKTENEESEGEASEERKMKNQRVKDEKKVQKNPPAQHLPYPHTPTKKDIERQYARFLDIFKRLPINIPFSEALEQMPTYVKFMKEILTKKRKYNDDEVIPLDVSCSAIIQRTLPTKEKDPGRVTLPLTIGNVNVGKTLIDLGSSINLIPLSVIQRIGGLDITRTRMTLQLADKSIKRPSGMAEDVLVKVDKLMVPIDFVVMDIEEDDDVPLILGRPFMKIERMMIDIDDGVMKVRVQDEEVCFNLWEAMKHSDDKDVCFKLDATEEVSPCEAKLEELKIDSKPIEVKLELKTLPSHLKYAFLEEDLKGISPSYCMHHIMMEDEYKPVAQPQRRLNPTVKEVVVPKKEGMTVITNDKNELIASRTVTGWRMCIDYRRLNKATRKDHFPLPFLDQMLERRMPFGLCNAPATFQRCMQAIFSKWIEKCIEVFMDGFSVFGLFFGSCLKNLDTVLKRCIETNLVLNWEKCHFMVMEGILLGHKISSKGIEVDKENIEVFEKLPPPVNVKGIRSFLGHAGFYRRFIKDFSKIAKPLSNLLNKDNRCSSWSKKEQIFHAIHYASKVLNDAQINYATTEKELLAIVYALEKFRSYLIGTKIVVYTDHAAIKYLITKSDSKPRIIRWMLLFQEFDLEIKDKKGTEKLVADHLSRLVNKEVTKHEHEVIEEFPDEKLLMVQERSWFTDMANYKASGLISDDFNWHQKKRFILIANQYVWDDPYLFKTGANNLLRRRNEMPLQSILEVEVLDCWGIDFVGPFPSSCSNQYILVAVDYVSKWVEAIASPKADGKTVIKFLKKNIFTRFGTPRVLISDGGSHFCNAQLAKALEHYGVKHKVASPYHPQTNGQAEVSNREIKKNLEKTVSTSRKDWSLKLDEALWAYRTTFKSPIGLTPFQMVYGKACHFPVELEHKAFRALKFLNFDPTLVGDKRKLQLHESKWSGPFKVKDVKPYGAIEIEDMEMSRSWTVNGQRLKPYFGDLDPVLFAHARPLSPGECARQARKIWPEKEFSIREDGKHRSFVEAIENLGWGKLMDLERYVNPELVREFYANALPTDLTHPFPYMTTVRNRHIRFDRDAINEFLGKPYKRDSEDDLCDYASTLARGNWDIPGITELLLLPGCNIKNGKSGLPVRAKGEDMTPLARLALLFFLHNVILRSHISDATMPILRLIYCFYKGNQVDIAKVISQELMEVVLSGIEKRTRPSMLPFPALIIGLIRKAGIIVSTTFRDPLGTIDDKHLLYHLTDQNAVNHRADDYLYQAMYQMSLNQPLYEPAHFYSRVAWPGDRPQFGDGVGTSAGANADGDDDLIDEEAADAFVDDDGDGENTMED